MGLNVELLRGSFELVLERAPNVTHRFYDNLFGQFPELQPLFKRNSREQQEKMLAEALVAVVDHLEDAPWLSDTLKGMGAKHVSYGVTEEMYPKVGTALLTTLAEVAGSDWSDELQQAWSDAYGAITALMLEGAANSSPVAATG